MVEVKEINSREECVRLAEIAVLEVMRGCQQDIFHGSKTFNVDAGYDKRQVIPFQTLRIIQISYMEAICIGRGMQHCLNKRKWGGEDETTSPLLRVSPHSHQVC